MSIKDIKTAIIICDKYGTITIPIKDVIDDDTLHEIIKLNDNDDLGSQYDIEDEIYEWFTNILRIELC